MEKEDKFETRNVSFGVDSCVGRLILVTDFPAITNSLLVTKFGN